MNIRHLSFRLLQIYVQVVRSGSISAAARAMHLTQPTVSLQMKRLAEAVGIDLHVAAEAFSTGATGSPHVARSAPVLAQGERGQPVAFSGRWRLKDSLYGVRLADKVGRQAALGKATVHVFEQMVNLGMGTANDSELIDALRAQASVQDPRPLEK